MKFETECREFAKMLSSLEQFFIFLKQNAFFTCSILDVQIVIYNWDLENLHKKLESNVKSQWLKKLGDTAHFCFVLNA